MKTNIMTNMKKTRAKNMDLIFKYKICKRSDKKTDTEVCFLIFKFTAKDFINKTRSMYEIHDINIS